MNNVKAGTLCICTRFLFITDMCRKREVDRYLFITGIIVLLILAVFYRGVMEEKKKHINLRKTLQEGYGKVNERKWQPGELERISFYGKRGNEAMSIDSQTWNDLDMDEVFKQMAYTGSSLGDDYLYALLHQPGKSVEELKRLEEKIAFYQTREKERLDLQLLFIELGRMKKYSLSQYLDYMEEKKAEGNGKHHLSNILLLLSPLLMFFSVGIGLSAFFLCLFINVYTYFKNKADMEAYLVSFRYILTMLDMAERIEKRLDPVWNTDKESLREVISIFRGFRKNSFLLMSRGRMAGQGVELILDYLRMCFHLDMIKFNSMLLQLQKDMKQVWKIYELLGELDSCLAIGAYRAYLPVYCIPDFWEKKEMDMVEGYHPLLKKAVSNSLHMEKNILLTGSNASGKSTFLKTIGLNVLLAQTIHTCTAKNFRLPLCRLYTSLSLKDSLFKQESYYMAEIKAIKRILDSAAGGGQVVCMVDEVLRGTNTRERIAASAQILLKMYRMGILCLAATHDRELTEILEGEYENYHFQEELAGGDVKFSYRLKSGRADSSNAIGLLEELGYGSEVTVGARRMIEEFEKKGEWK